jgi:hypothetical protein
MTDSQFCWYITATWLGVIGTFILAIAAIWGDLIRAKFYGPRLQIRLENPRGEVSVFSDGVVSRYYHLRVSNNRRTSPAHNVRVVIKEIFKPAADGTMQPEPLSGPVQLVWQFQGSQPQFQTIGPDSICDLAYLRRNEVLTLTPIHASISMAPSLTLSANQRLIATIVALSDECESNELRVQIDWDGNWSDDSEVMRNHLVVQTV